MMKRGAIFAAAATVVFSAAALGAAVTDITFARAQTGDAASLTSSALAPASVSAPELSRLRDGLSAARNGDWETVLYMRDSASDPLVRKILAWRYASDRGSPSTFAETADALATMQGWPARETMRRKAEQLIFDSGLDAEAQLRFLAQDGGPLSGDGALAIALAHRRLGRGDQATEMAREVWRTRALTPRAEDVLRSQFTLRASDHAARADFLLWRDDASGAARLAPLVSGVERRLIDARIALQRRPRRGLQALVDAANAVRPDDPGLLYDRARYARRDGRSEDALPIAARIDPASAPAIAREPIAEERRLYVTRALNQGAPRTAYRLVSNNGLTSGAAFADSEWIAGWIALRFLNDPALARGHFERLGANVTAPVSKSRALYWQGEAAKASGSTASALTLYSEAAKFDFTFYGQLAAEKLDENRLLTLTNAPAPTPDEVAAFENRELVRALRAVAQAGTRDDFESIAFFVDDQLQTPTEHELLAAIARQVGHDRTAVRSAKAGIFRGIVAKTAAYPVIELPPLARIAGRPEPALVHALIRQETEFDPYAVSRAGARGMMQLMPGTALATARIEGLSYDRDRLLSDASYNVTLGAAHVQHLLEDWRGSYVLTIAAYNAGPARVRQWIEDFGDPRAPGADPVDWIERIPFEETRNYVMRVLENVQVYRSRLSGEPTKINLLEDLQRGR